MPRLGIVALFLALLPAAAYGQIITGTDVGVGPQVKAFSDLSGAQQLSFFAFNPLFSGGVRVASGDIDGDGYGDIIAGAGPGGLPQVSTFNGRTGDPIASFAAYGLFAGGVYVGAGDVNGDGLADILTGAGAGGSPHVKVFDGPTSAELQSYFAYGPAFTGGVRVAGTDVNGDGFADTVTGTGPGAAHVKVFDGQTQTELHSFFAYPGTLGVFVGGGDVNNDGFDDIITGADAGAAPHVKVFDGVTGDEIMSFFAFDALFDGGVRVAGADLNADGFADIIAGAGPGGTPHVRVFDGQTGDLLGSFFAYDGSYDGGIFVAASPQAVPEPRSAALWLIVALGVAICGAKIHRCSASMKPSMSLARIRRT